MSAILAFEALPGKPVLRGQAFFWSVIRELGRDGSTFSIHAVLQRTNQTERSTVADYFRRLEGAGIIEQTGEVEQLRRGQSRPLFRLLKSPGATPRFNRDGSVPLGGRGQQQLWNVLRGPEARSGMTTDELVLWASTDDVAVSKETAKSFVRRLAAAGYLAKVRHGCWKLKPSMNTGPLPPLFLKTKIVFDQNRKVTMGPVEAVEEAP